jgi:oxysterol-binding protein-related protein 9/10/11
LDDTKFKNPVATFDGKWTETIELKYTKTGDTVKMFDAADQPTPRVEKELNELDEWDSRRIWAKVTENILKKDFKTANLHKNQVEEDQRKRIKAMPGGETTYEGKLFHKDPNAPSSNGWRYKKLDSMLEKSRKKFAEKAAK